MCRDSLWDGSLVWWYVFIIQPGTRQITPPHLLSEPQFPQNDNAASALRRRGEDKQTIFNIHEGLQRLIINLKLIFVKYQ